MRGDGYLGPHGRQMLEEGEFFGGWEDADRTRTQLAPLEKFSRGPRQDHGMASPVPTDSAPNSRRVRFPKRRRQSSSSQSVPSSHMSQ